jgi:YbgC/YbaW family acyl-CoA thioester hydrolase
MEEPEGKDIFETTVEIRFADIDAMGHVNNAVYFSYFEQARMAYFKDRVARIWDWNEDGVIVARNEIDYIYPVFLNDRMKLDRRVSQSVIALLWESAFVQQVNLFWFVSIIKIKPRRCFQKLGELYF